ncbi:hypothetical protein WA026_005071 [Henosepilachna vigintioctopunctata]|uniref:Uncharacterized protein n=1 Tax=Henosepilachna vigintioctopunctata TaxID=420089 RepID=A0AAW1UUE3_9CUCU
MSDSLSAPKGWRGFVKRYRGIVFVVTLVGSVHWVWYALQKNPRLVPPSERKDPFEIAQRIASEKWAEFVKSDKS